MIEQPAVAVDVRGVGESYRATAVLAGIDPRIVTGGSGSGGVHDTGDGRGLFPWGGRWISYATLFASAQVESIDIAGRTVSVPWHGRTLIIWAGRNSPSIGIRGPDGDLLATTRIPTRGR